MRSENEAGTQRFTDMRLFTLSSERTAYGVERAGSYHYIMLFLPVFYFILKKGRKGEKERMR